MDFVDLLVIIHTKRDVGKGVLVVLHLLPKIFRCTQIMNSVTHAPVIIMDAIIRTNQESSYILIENAL